MAEETTATTTETEAAEQPKNEPAPKQNAENELSTEAIDKYVDQKVKQATEKYAKEKAALEKKITAMEKANKTESELQELERKKKETEFAEREKALLDKEHKMYALEQVKELGLDKGGITALELADFITADSEEEMANRAKRFGTLVKGLVEAEVKETFKTHGRYPNVSDSGKGGDKPSKTLAETLGEQAAARNKAAQDVLKYYK